MLCIFHHIFLKVRSRGIISLLDDWQLSAKPVMLLFQNLPQAPSCLQSKWHLISPPSVCLHVLFTSAVCRPTAFPDSGCLCTKHLPPQETSYSQLFTSKIPPANPFPSSPWPPNLKGRVGPWFLLFKTMPDASTLSIFIFQMLNQLPGSQV